MQKIEFNVSGNGSYDIEIIKPGLDLVNLIHLLNSGYGFEVLNNGKEMYLTLGGELIEHVANIINSELYLIDYSDFRREE